MKNLVSGEYAPVAGPSTGPARLPSSSMRRPYQSQFLPRARRRRGLYETSEVEICVQVIWDGSLASNCGGIMDVCKKVCRFEELGSLHGVLSAKEEGQGLRQSEG
jgi:hypothetical protein